MDLCSIVNKEEISTEADIEKGFRDRLGFIRRATQRLLKMPFMTARSDWSCLEKLRRYLREGCTIIVDKKIALKMINVKC